MRPFFCAQILGALRCLRSWNATKTEKLERNED